MLSVIGVSCVGKTLLLTQKNEDRRSKRKHFWVVKIHLACGVRVVRVWYVVRVFDSFIILW